MNQTQGTAPSSRSSGYAGRIAAIVVLIAAIALALFTSQIKFSFASDPLGPRAFPYLLSGFLAACAVWYLLVPGTSDDRPSAAARQKIAIFVVLICVCVAVMPWLGFITAMALLCGGLARLFGATWLQAAVSGLLQALGWWLIFGFVMGGVLPRGPLGF